MSQTNVFMAIVNGVCLKEKQIILNVLSENIMKTRVCKDGFMWFVLSMEQALALWIEGSTEIYKLYDDETEGACECVEEIVSHNGDFGIELGFVKDILPVCPKC